MAAVFLCSACGKVEIVILVLGELEVLGFGVVQHPALVAVLIAGEVSLCSRTDRAHI